MSLSLSLVCEFELEFSMRVPLISTRCSEFEQRVWVLVASL